MSNAFQPADRLQLLSPEACQNKYKRYELVSSIIKRNILINIEFQISTSISNIIII